MEDNPESHQISNMVIYKGFMPLEGVVGDSEAGHIYTCSHLRANGSCGNYEHRPLMCAGYPYGKKCRYKGCEFSQGERETKWHKYVGASDLLDGCTPSHIADSAEWNDYRRACAELEDHLEQTSR